MDLNVEAGIFQQETLILGLEVGYFSSFPLVNSKVFQF